MNGGSSPAAVLLIGGISGDIGDSKMGPDAPEHSGGFWTNIMLPSLRGSRGPEISVRALSLYCISLVA